ncbi:uncharacterized protein K460DRAFT_297127 [Cucurbitaria berberidis CBS 394.84]|uniref:Uncharacterized protein n=1 Tax=Cucurbitaria berberidis CBS 394.84 TaxID=1168544 RepID=A0A9P4L3S4_9PLEO|nr:uncharacterized protein K460DRAFT_297127 [Cucurbitaria berberidis CBS 394.84]KAF1840619.1 hypothetical protein K460DRAFT_297127 [Cucurbitaria berberidis CBS 394.84]
MTNEVLVHISTPTTTQNDALYRSIYEAYLVFEPQKRSTAKSQQEQHEQKHPTASRLNPTAAPNFAANPSMFSTSKDSYGSFPSYLSDGLANEYGPTSTPPHYGSLEDCSVPISSRLNRLEHIHLNWKDRTTPKLSAVDKARRSRQASCDAEEANTTFIEDTQLAVQTLQSQLQDTYSITSEDTSEDDVVPEHKSHEDRQLAVKNSQDTGGTRVEVLASAHSMIPGDVNTKPQEDPRLNSTLELYMPVSQVRSDNQPNLDGHATSVDSLDLTKLPVDAFSPASKVSVAQPGTLPSQITDHLAKIVLQHPTRFKPSKKLRTPKPDDRGYWSVNCSVWRGKLQHEFWSSLCEHVLSGRLGWGSTVHRESSTRVLGQIKLYCWGEVVEHMWLVLWICSRGRVSGSRSKWYDADGIAVFEVP